MLEGGVNLPSIIVSCVYEKKPVTLSQLQTTVLIGLKRLSVSFPKETYLSSQLFIFQPVQKLK